MNLLGMLRKLGDRLGIVELHQDESRPSEPAKVQTRSVTLSELIMTIQVTDVRALARVPAEMFTSFEEIFNAAKIQAPPNGWTVDRLVEFVDNERIRNMAHSEAQKETLRMLGTEKVHATDIVKDAIARDHALDAFEEVVIKKRQVWLREQNQLLDDLKKQQQQVESEINQETAQWNEWRGAKREREKAMARAVGFLIDQPVISIEEE